MLRHFIGTQQVRPVSAADMAEAEQGCRARLSPPGGAPSRPGIRPCGPLFPGNGDDLGKLETLHVEK